MGVADTMVTNVLLRVTENQFNPSRDNQRLISPFPIELPVTSGTSGHTSGGIEITPFPSSGNLPYPSVGNVNPNNAIAPTIQAQYDISTSSVTSCDEDVTTEDLTNQELSDQELSNQEDDQKDRTKKDDVY